MKNKFAGVAVAFAASLIFFSLMLANPRAGSTQAAVSSVSHAAMEAPPECADCENRCEAWISKCKEGGQYACYKAAACLCKCNLDEGGCGSSKDALRECYEQNEKAARELGPSEGR